MSQVHESAQTFILSNARQLERHLFASLFQRGSPDHVRTALLAYQNPDGGFGNVLEPRQRTVGEAVQRWSITREAVTQ